MQNLLNDIVIIIFFFFLFNFFPMFINKFYTFKTPRHTGQAQIVNIAKFFFIVILNSVSQ